MLEDKLLIWRLKRGHQQAMARVYYKYKGLLLKIACGLIRDRTLAEDVVQDVFVSLAESVDRLRIDGSLKGYLIRCVVNRTRNLNEAAILRRTQDLEEDGPIVCNRSRPEAWAILGDELVHLHQALEQLPVEQREAVTLHLRAGLSFRQIADLQEVSINTVLSRYRYGLDRLRSIMNCQNER
jgi:RNA polymerase sigma factor (sigma-70 family)